MKFKSFLISASLIIIGCKNNTLYDSKISQLEETSIIDLVPNIQKQGMKWLLKNMDTDDKNLLSTSFLIDNCNYAQLEEIKYSKNYLTIYFIKFLTT